MLSLKKIYRHLSLFLSILFFILYNNVCGGQILGSWEILSSHNNFLGRSGAVVGLNTTLYIVGGLSSISSSFPVEMASISSDGNISLTWNILSSNLVEERAGGVCFSANGYLYCLSGGNFYDIPSTGERAKINIDGTLGQWTVFCQLPFARANSSIATTDKYILIIGGTNGYALNDIYRCKQMLFFYYC